MSKEEQMSGKYEMLMQICDEFTQIVTDFADDQAICTMVEQWFFNQLPVVANGMYADLLCHAVGFVNITKVTEDLLNAQN